MRTSVVILILCYGLCVVAKPSAEKIPTSAKKLKVINSSNIYSQIELIENLQSGPSDRSPTSLPLADAKEKK